MTERIDVSLGANPDRQPDTAQEVKRQIRERVSRILIENKIARPDPIFHLSLDHYIADFEGNEEATENLASLPEWKRAKRVFITPDRSTQFLRETALKQGKEIEVTTYGISRGAVLLNRSLIPQGQEAFAASLDGMERFGVPLTTVSDLVRPGKVDLMVTGALAISKAHGGRTGKGAGWFDAEWIMWRKMGLIDPDTPVVGIVHDAQVVDEAFELDPWDAIVGIVVTPSQIIRTPRRTQPSEIYWGKMDPQWLNAIPLMVELNLIENSRKAP